jgi:hypothetical protein
MQEKKRPSETDDLVDQILLVAVARNHLNLEFAWAARRMLFAPVHAEGVVAAPSILTDQAGQHVASERVDLAGRIRPGPVHCILKRPNRRRRQLDIARSFAAFLQRLDVVGVQRDAVRIITSPA